MDEVEERGRDWTRSLRDHARDLLALPVDTILTEHDPGALRPSWQAKPATPPSSARRETDPRASCRHGLHATAPFVAALRQREAGAARLPEFLIPTVVRSGDARSDLWDGFDLEKAVWAISAARMKAGKERLLDVGDAHSCNRADHRIRGRSSHLRRAGCDDIEPDTSSAGRVPALTSPCCVTSG